MLKINNLCKLSVNNFIDETLIINKSGIEIYDIAALNVIVLIPQKKNLQ